MVSATYWGSTNSYLCGGLCKGKVLQSTPKENGGFLSSFPVNPGIEVCRIPKVVALEEQLPRR